MRGRGQPWGAAAHPRPSGTPAEGGALPGLGVLEPWGGGGGVKTLNLPWTAVVGSLQAMSGEESESELGRGGAFLLGRCAHSTSQAPRGTPLSAALLRTLSLTRSDRAPRFADGDKLLQVLTRPGGPPPGWPLSQRSLGSRPAS